MTADKTITGAEAVIKDLVQKCLDIIFGYQGQSVIQ